MSVRRLLLLGALLTFTAAMSTAGTYFSQNFNSATQGLFTHIGPDGSPTCGFGSSMTPVGCAIGTNFLLTSGSVDVMGPTYFPGFCVAPASGVCIDTNGETPGTLTSTPFNLPNGSFWLTFVLNGTDRQLGGDNMASARVTMASGANVFFDQLFTLPQTYVGTWNELVTIGGGLGANTTIKIASSNPPHVSATIDPNSPATGLILDNVSVTDALVTLPEPGTFLGGLLAFPMFWFVRRRRTR